MTTNIRTMRAGTAFIVSISVPLEYYDGLSREFRGIDCDGDSEAYDILAQLCLVECVYNLSVGNELQSLKRDVMEILLEEMVSGSAHSDSFQNFSGRRGGLLREFMINVLVPDIYYSLDDFISKGNYELIRYTRYSATISRMELYDR